jgi:hypothetical protein
MSQKSRLVFSALAAIATVGATQLALGHDLADRFQAVSEQQPAGAAVVNRAAKADREARLAQTAQPAHTVLLKVDSLADTSVLVRIPIQKDARNLPPAKPLVKPASDKATKMTIACEPPVSVLTEVAKLLQPGRCVT